MHQLIFPRRIKWFISMGLLYTSQAASVSNGTVLQAFWKGEIRELDQIVEDKSVIRSLINFITGKEKVLLKNPVSYLTNLKKCMWILDQGTGQLISVNPQSGEVDVVNSPDGRPFTSLTDLCTDGQNIFIADSYLNQIFVFEPQSGTCRVLNPDLTFTRPSGIAFNKTDSTLWIAESGAHQVSIITARGELVSCFGKRGTSDGEFNYPTAVALDDNGMAYIIDALNFRIQIFDSQGKFKGKFGQAGNASGYFARPKGIAVDGYGHIYVTDALFHNVQVFSRSGEFLYYFGRQGQGNGEFWMPHGITIDDDSRVYVADRYNHRIQIFQLVQGHN